MLGTKILIIDDDYHICQILKSVMEAEGATAIVAQNGVMGLRSFYSEQPDIVLLDIMMPEMDGWAVCRQIRQLSNVPVIMLTALHGEEDVVRGLEFGAIDYITKPFSSKVLIARIRTALRQAALTTSFDSTTTFSDGYLGIDLKKRRVTIAGEPIKLSVTEYKLLTLLFSKAGQVLSFEEILSEVWNKSDADNADYVRVYVWHLRKKLEKNPKSPKYILTEYGVGYRFADHSLYPS